MHHHLTLHRIKRNRCFGPLFILPDRHFWRQVWTLNQPKWLIGKVHVLGNACREQYLHPVIANGVIDADLHIQPGIAMCQRDDHRDIEFSIGAAFLTSG
ncbi:hypothetical protein D3C75_807540 [compost metagenome]